MTRSYIRYTGLEDRMILATSCFLLVLLIVRPGEGMPQPNFLPSSGKLVY